MLEANAIIRSLSLIFWGTLIFLFNFKVGDFDLFNDAIGMFLICIGVFSLSKQPGGERHHQYMLYVKVIAILLLIDAVLKNFSFARSWHFLFPILGLFVLVAIHLFCLAIRDMCEVNNLMKSLKSWKKTFLLFVILNEIPFGLFYLVSIGAMLTNSSFILPARFIRSQPWSALVIALLSIPLLHFFVSSARMQKESANNSSAPKDIA